MGLVSCYPVCRLLPIFVHRGLSSTRPVAPLPQSPWAPPTADARRCQLSCASSSCHLTMNRLGSSRTPRYLFPAFFAAAAVDHSAVSTPNTKGKGSVNPSVARKAPRSSTLHLSMLNLTLPARSRVLPASRRPEQYPIITGDRS